METKAPLSSVLPQRNLRYSFPPCRDSINQYVRGAKVVRFFSAKHIMYTGIGERQYIAENFQAASDPSLVN